MTEFISLYDYESSGIVCPISLKKSRKDQKKSNFVAQQRILTTQYLGLVARVVYWPCSNFYWPGHNNLNTAIEHFNPVMPGALLVKCCLDL